MNSSKIKEVNHCRFLGMFFPVSRCVDNDSIGVDRSTTQTIDSLFLNVDVFFHYAKLSQTFARKFQNVLHIRIHSYDFMVHSPLKI